MAERNTKRTLWTVLGGLIGLVVVLVVAIVIVNVVKTNEHTYPTSIHTKELSELNAEAAELSVEEAKLLYEEAILNAPTELIREQTKVEYGRYLMDQDLTEEGLNQLLTANAEVLGASYKMLLYAALRDYFYTIDNQELYEKYINMAREVVETSNFAAGG